MKNSDFVWGNFIDPLVDHGQTLSIIFSWPSSFFFFNIFGWCFLPLWFFKGGLLTFLVMKWSVLILCSFSIGCHHEHWLVLCDFSYGFLKWWSWYLVLAMRDWGTLILVLCSRFDGGWSLTLACLIRFACFSMERCVFSWIYGFFFLLSRQTLQLSLLRSTDLSYLWLSSNMVYGLLKTYSASGEYYMVYKLYGWSHYSMLYLSRRSFYGALIVKLINIHCLL